MSSPAMTRFLFFGRPYLLCRWIMMVVVTVWMIQGESAPVANHVVRSARPGAMCNVRRDVVLLSYPNSNGSYLQCQRQSANGSIGIWARIECPSGQEFSYSRQRCSFPTMDSVPAANNASVVSGKAPNGLTSVKEDTRSEFGSAMVMTTVTPKSGGKPHQKSTVMPVLIKQQGRGRTPVIRRPTAASRPTLIPNRTFHTEMTTQSSWGHIITYGPQNELAHEASTHAVTVDITVGTIPPHRPLSTEAYAVPFTEAHIPNHVPSIDTESPFQYTAAANPYQQTEPPRLQVTAATTPRRFHPITVGTPRRRLPPTPTTPTTISTTLSTAEPTTVAPPAPETAAVPLLPIPYGLLGYPCSHDLKCIDPDSVCLGNMCHCAEGFVIQTNAYQHFCAPFVIQTAAQPPELQPDPIPTMPPPPVFVGVGQPCSSHGPYCHTLGAQCRQGTCRCPKGHIDQDNICTFSGPKPGQSCKLGDQCTGGAMCIRDKCTCKDGDIIQNGICILDQRPKPGHLCNAHWGPEWGQCLGGSYCAPETALCTCPAGTVLMNTVCVAKVVQVGQQCQSPPQECADGAQCINNVCQAVIHYTQASTVMDTGPTCPNGWLVLDFDQKRYCAPAMLRLGEMCLSPVQTCTGGSICRHGQCACPDNFTPLHDYCIPAPPPAPGQRRALGTTCVDSSQCAWAGGLCQDEHCVCPAGTNVMLGSCRQPELPYSVTAGGYCAAPVHCVPGLACVYGVCICLPGHDCEGFLSQPSLPGASCAYSQRCSDGSSCTNGWCICTHTDMIVDNGRCISNFNKHTKGDITTLIPAPAHKPQPLPPPLPPLPSAPPPTIPVGPVIPIPVTYAYNMLQIVGAEGRSEYFRPAPVLPGLIPNGLGEYARVSLSKTKT